MEVNVRVGIRVGWVVALLVIAVYALGVRRGLGVAKSKVSGGAATAPDLAIVVDKVLFPGLLLDGAGCETGTGGGCEDSSNVW